MRIEGVLERLKRDAKLVPIQPPAKMGLGAQNLPALQVGVHNFPIPMMQTVHPTI